MTRVAVGIGIGIVVAVVGMAALGLHAQTIEPDENTRMAADEAGVDAIDLQGAVNTTGLTPRAYLITVGELSAPVITPACGWPICGPLGQRIWCIEGIESHHGAAMYNPVPHAGQHAQGFLGWLPSTARSVGVVIGDRYSEWDGARRMLALGRGREFYGVAAGLC